MYIERSKNLADGRNFADIRDSAPVALCILMALTLVWEDCAAADAVKVHNMTKDHLVEVQQVAYAWPPFDAPEFGHQAQPRVVGEASGIIVAPETILTACHVIGRLDDSRLLTPGDGILVRRTGGEWRDARLSRHFGQGDLCELTSDIEIEKELQFRSADTLKVGEDVFSLGNPNGFRGIFSSGEILSVNAGWTDSSILHSAISQPGSSGGGLFDSKGRLIAILTKSSGDWLSLATSIDNAKALTADNRTLGLFPKALGSPALSLRAGYCSTPNCWSQLIFLRTESESAVLSGQFVVQMGNEVDVRIGFQTSCDALSLPAPANGYEERMLYIGVARQFEQFSYSEGGLVVVPANARIRINASSLVKLDDRSSVAIVADGGDVFASLSGGAYEMTGYASFVSNTAPVNGAPCIDRHPFDDAGPSVVVRRANSVATIRPEEVDLFRALLRGEVSAPGAQRAGFIINRGNGPESLTGEIAGGQLTYRVDKLLCGTTYSFQAYATFGKEVVYGQNIRFRTLECKQQRTIVNAVNPDGGA